MATRDVDRDDAKQTSGTAAETPGHLALISFALNHVREAAFLVDRNGRFSYVNDEACRTLGYSQEELLAMGVPDIDPEYPMERLQESWDQAKEFSSITFESVHLAKDGRRFPVEITTTYFEYESSDYVLALVRDISEQKAAQHQLRLLTKALDKVGETIFLMGENSPLFLHVNQSATTTLGYTYEQLVGGMGVYDIDPGWTPETWEKFWKDLTAQGSLTFESQHRTKGGRVFPVEITGNYFEFDGQVYNMAICRDITERKRSEDALRKSEQQFRNLIESWPDEIARYDRKCRRVYVNPMMESSLGVSAELLGRTPVETYPGSQAIAFYQKKLREVLSTGVATTFDMGWEAPAVQPKYRSLRLVPERDPNGAVTGVFAIARDISDHKRAEDLLRISEQRLNEAQRLARIGSWVWYPDGSLRWSDTMFELFGVPLDVAPNMDLFLSRVHPDDGAKVVKGFGAWLASDRIHQEVEYKLRLVDGTIRHIVAIGQKEYDGAGQVARAFGTCQDVTERKLTEEKLQKADAQIAEMMESITDSFLMLDRDWRFTYVNEQAAKNSRKTREEMLGKCLWDLFPDLIDAVGYAELRQTMVDRVPNQYEIYVPSLGLWFQNHAYPTRDGISVYSADITERKQAEEKLRQADAKIVEILESITDGFIAVDHDWRFTYVNARAAETMGMSREEVVGKRVPDLFPGHPSQDIKDAMAGRTTAEFETYVKELGLWFESHLYPTKEGVSIYSRDITARKQVEIELARVNRALRMLSDSNQALIFIGEEEELLDKVCEIVVGVGGYRMAWVGFAEQDEKKTVRTVAQAGYGSESVDAMGITWADDAGGPIGTAIRSGKRGLTRDIANDPDWAAWHEAAKEQGFQSAIVLPLVDDKRVFGALCIYSSELEAFDDSEIEILVELAGDLSFGITAMHTRIERKRAEDSLAESEFRHRQVFENASDCLYLLEVTPDRRFRYIDANPATQAAIGLPQSELVGRYVDEDLDDDLADRINGGFRSCLEAGKIVEFEVDLPLPVGPRIYDTTLVPLRDETGRIHRIVGIGRDISERKRAEELLKAREQEYRTLAETSPDIIIRYDREGRRKYVNQAYERVVGTARSVALGAIPDQNWQADMAVEEYRERIAQVMDTGVATEFTMTWPDPEGAAVTHSLLVVPEFDSSGQVTGALTIGRNINALKEAERQYLALTENSPDIIARLDRSGTYLYVNNRMDKDIGIPVHDLIGKRYGEVYAERTDGELPEDTLAIREAIDRVIQTGEAVEMEGLIALQDGNHSYDVRLIPELDDAGRVASVLHIARDITERKRAEQQLRSSEAEFRATFELGAGGQAQADPATGRLLRVNRNLCQLVGYSEEELLGLTFSEITHPEDAGRDLELYRKLADGELSEYTIEKRIIHKSGAIRWLQVTATMLRDSDGRPSRALAIGIDVTEQKLAAEALRNVLRSARTMVMHAVVTLRDGWDEPGKPIPEQYFWDNVFYDEDAAQDVLPLEVPTGKTYRDVWGGAKHPDDVAPMDLVSHSAFTSGASNWSQEFRSIDRYGQLHWFAQSALIEAVDAGKWRVTTINTDITDRKRAEEQLLLANGRIAEILESIADAFVTLDRNWRFTYVNEQAARNMGRSREELIGESLQELYPEMMPTEAHRHSERTMAEGTPEHYEIFMPSLGRWFDSHAYPTRDGISIYSTDITEQKRVDDLLRASVIRMAQQEAALIALTKKDALVDGNLQASLRRLTEASAKALGVERVSLWRYAPGGKVLRCVDLYELSADRHSEGLELFQEAYPAYFQGLADSHVIVADDARTDPVTSEFTKDYLVPSGVTSMLDVPIQLRGSLDGVLCHEHIGPKREWTLDERTFAVAMANFVTLVLEEYERKQAQEELRESQQAYASLVNTVEGIVWELDVVSFRFTFVSQQAERLLGYPAEDWLSIPTFWEDHLHPDDKWALGYCMAATEAMRDHDFQYRMIAADGRVVWLHDLVTVVAEEGKATKLRGIMVDITDRKIAEEERAHLEDQLRQAQKIEALGTLAGGIAHDFNNILGTILGNVELALEDTQNPEMMTSLEQIRQAGQRARDLTQQILFFGRLQPTSRRVTALLPVVEQCVSLLHATLPASVNLEYSVAPDAPYVLADPTQILQVLVNMGANASHAIQGQPGDIDIRIDPVTLDDSASSLSPDLRPGLYARISVSDTGCGMDEATRQRIFEPFFTTKQLGEGTGLGLSVVHGIMRSHDGAIVVHSEVGKGSTFDLYLPAANTSAAVVEEKKSGEPTGKGHGQHILCIDDDESLVFLVKRMLERRGYRVSGFTDLGDALEALVSDPYQFDVVVTDYNMPGMSGLEVARAVQQVRPDLPVAVASGYITEALRLEAESLGVTDLIFKPNAMDEYCDVVERLLQRHSGEGNEGMRE